MFSSPCTFYFNPRSHERSDTPIAIPTTPAQFQSTLPREERLSNVDFKSIPYISIHAPTRGATKNIVRLGTVQSVFQSTLPREERLKPNAKSALIPIFQSTLPREERLLHGYMHEIYLVFQSTLPREERLINSPFNLCKYNFNPRSHERSDVD